MWRNGQVLILGLKPKNENTYSHTGSYILGLNHFNLGIKKPQGLKVLYSQKKTGTGFHHHVHGTFLHPTHLQLNWRVSCWPLKLPALIKSQLAAESWLKPKSCRVAAGGGPPRLTIHVSKTRFAQLNNWCPAKLFPKLVPNFHLKIKKTIVLVLVVFYTFSRSSHWLEWDQKAHGNWQPHESICLTERWTGRREADGLQMCREMMRNVDVWWGNTWAQNTKSATESVFHYISIWFYPFHAISYHFLQESIWTHELEGLDSKSMAKLLYFPRIALPPPTTKVTLGSHCRNILVILHHQTGEFAEWRYHSVW